MAVVDRTLDFRDALKEYVLPDSKRRKITATSGASPVIPGKEFVAEAYLIVCEQTLKIRP
jgi:hypothetical protein